MKRLPRAVTALLGLAFILAACAPGGQPTPQSSAPGPQAFKRITASIPSNPYTLSSTILPADNVTPQGVEAVDAMVSTGLQFIDNRGVAQAQLADQVPTTDNGQWKVNPDGTMEITWRVRPNAEWHDGKPFTSADLQFTWQLTQDRELVAFRHNAAAFDAIERTETPDDRTLVTYWKRPFIYANLVFGFSTARPLYPVAKHILERPYLANKEGFCELPHWSSEYVGA
jgi:ABC-type transport system substrate-binding protein